MAATLTINVNRIPDGDYMTVLDDSNGVRLKREVITYTNGVLFTDLAAIDGDVTVKGYVDDNAIISLNAAYLEGVSVSVSGFDIASLFANGEQGSWYDPSDLSTLFQDSAGTIPVTADGQSVGLVLDKSGNGNHATQLVSASRPTYKTDGTLYWLSFDGVDDMMVSTYTPNGNIAMMISGFTSVSDGGIPCGSQDGDARLYLARQDNNSAAGYGSIPFTVMQGGIWNDPSVVAVYGDGSNVVLRDDGAEVYSAAESGAIGVTQPIYIGATNYHGSPTNKITGNIYTVIVRESLTSLSDIEGTEQYIAGKTGVII